MRFAKVPATLARDRGLSLGARAVYPILLDLAYDAGRRRPEDAVELPPLEVVASDAVGCSRTAFKGYVGELRKSGWIVTRRKSRREPLLWRLYDDASRAKSDPLSRADSDPLGGASRADSDPLGGDVPISSLVDAERATALSVSRPPAPVKIDGQNLPHNALAQACGINPSGGQAGQLAAALNGAKSVPVGIRQQFWREGNDGARKAWAEFPEVFEQGLARVIPERAKLYRAKMPAGSMLTPTALARYWTDLPTMASAQRKRDGLSAAEVLSL